MSHLRVVTDTEALGVAWARLQAEVDRREGILSTSSWVGTGGASVHKVTAHYFPGDTSSVTVASDDLAAGLTEAWERLTRDDWDDE